MNYPNLYHNGIIASWYLKKSQMKFYEMLLKEKLVVAKCHRRFGKGTTVLTYVAERCLKENIIVRYGAETQGQAYQIFDFLMGKIFYKCPDMKPRLRNGHYEFKSGSRIYIFGVKDSGEIDKARGTEAHIIILDEYGFWRFKAEYILKSILLPQLMNTKGQALITSTPPEDLTHDYVNQVIKAEKGGYLFNWTLQDSVNIGEKTEKEKQDIIDDCGGEDSVHYQREYMCNLIPTKERLVIPEAQDEELYVGKMDRPPHVEFYVCMDLGLIDHTAVLFGYLDFKNSRLVVEDEYWANYNSTAEIVEACKIKEKKLKMHEIYRRIGDCERQQLWDMSNDHGYPVAPIIKRSKQSGKGFRDSVINQLRVGIKEGKLLVDPDGCPNTVRQLKYGIWNERRTDFERTETMGHLDALMSVCYMFDNISWDRNPYPSMYHKLRESDSYINIEELRNRDKQRHGLKKLTGR